MVGQSVKHRARPTRILRTGRNKAVSGFARVEL